eukprot:g44570.t1
MNCYILILRFGVDNMYFLQVELVELVGFSGIQKFCENVFLRMVTRESGPPHMKSFVTRVAVGEFTAEGEGNSKKLSKKRAAITVLQELKKLPPLPTGPEYGQGMNPISRLAQIQQAKKEKEPEYLLLSEKGLPRRREFVMQ